jgi:hypothetical protein
MTCSPFAPFLEKGLDEEGKAEGFIGGSVVSRLQRYWIPICGAAGQARPPDLPTNL